MQLLIIGGSDAGISAALRAHELEPGAEVTLVLADDYPNFSICGLPYYLSGETPDWRQLAHRTEFPGIRILRGHTARSIDARGKAVLVEHAGTEQTIRYDRLIVATGAAPMRPELPGSELDGVFLLHTMNDSFAVHKHLTEREPRTAVLIGAGYIGLEMADALTQRGLEVTLLSRTETVLPTVDPALGVLVGDELRRHGVRVLTGLSATRIEQQSGDSTSPRLLVTDSAGTQHPADMVILAVGVRPASDLARRAGAELGVRGAIAVTHRMQTSLPDVLAAGDCVETYHRLLDQPVYISLGTIAHKQGRIAGENALGGDREFAGALGTQSLKVFDLAIARTGLMDHEARNGGFDPLTVPMEANDHKAYYPGAVTLHIRMTGDRQTGRLLGAQILGHRKAEISKRIDIVAAALFQNASVEQLNDMDLSYTPPFSSPWDPVQVAAQAWSASQTASGNRGQYQGTGEPLSSTTRASPH
ncbi:CoA-disulfide reductase [Brucella tritici]|uniref:CoA-disulfide reductase n=1 Tax=Brucella tritici TaxID=94626 RepID=A0A833FLI3_9HYPH|nr:FAD-dependent oxidoreductase [Brucella tritici]KAB2661785.1 CoA-disulfide reductase [Brucella tritici]